MKSALHGKWGLAVVLLCIIAAVVRAETASAPGPSPRVVDAAERARLGREVAQHESQWRLDARRSYPADHWSQDDDFANTERRWVRDEAERRGLAQSEFYRAIDEDLRAHPPQPPRKATSSPCKPRAFYD